METLEHPGAQIKVMPASSCLALHPSRVKASTMILSWCLASSPLHVPAAAASLHILLSLQCLQCCDISLTLLQGPAPLPGSESRLWCSIAAVCCLRTAGFLSHLCSAVGVCFLGAFSLTAAQLTVFWQAHLFSLPAPRGHPSSGQSPHPRQTPRSLRERQQRSRQRPTRRPLRLPKRPPAPKPPSWRRLARRRCRASGGGWQGCAMPSGCGIALLPQQHSQEQQMRGQVSPLQA